MTNKENTGPLGNGWLRVIQRIPNRLFAIGDLHGCANETNSLLAHLEEKEGLGPDDQVIFIGDYIDRGLASKEVVDRLIAFKAKHPQTVFLKGNHEDMLMAYLGLGGLGAEVYLHNGGLQFFSSYQIAPFARPSELRSALPADHLAFLTSLEHGVSLAEFVFVHAGLHPAKPLDQQTTEDIMWIRDPFVESKHEFGKTVVFGHTPFEDLALHLPYKIGVDTGLVFGNMLTAAELVHGNVYQIDAGERAVKVTTLAGRLGVPGTLQ